MPHAIVHFALFISFLQVKHEVLAIQIVKLFLDTLKNKSIQGNGRQIHNGIKCLAYWVKSGLINFKEFGDWLLNLLDKNKSQLSWVS